MTGHAHQCLATLRNFWGAFSTFKLRCFASLTQSLLSCCHLYVTYKYQRCKNLNGIHTRMHTLDCILLNIVAISSPYSCLYFAERHPYWYLDTEFELRYCVLSWQAFLLARWWMLIFSQLATLWIWSLCLRSRLVEWAESQLPFVCHVPNSFRELL